MQVMDPFHPAHALDGPPYLGQLDVGGHPLEQHVHRLAEQGPGAGEDEEADAGGDEGVGVVPPRRPHHERGHDHAQGREHVGEDLEIGPLDVEVVPGAGTQEEDSRQVHPQAEHAQGEHAAALHHGGVAEPLQGLVQDEEADAHEDGPVHERGQDLDPMVPVGACLGGRALRHLHGEEGEAEADHVRQQMAGVGQEGEAARQQAPHGLHGQDQGREDEHGQEAPSVVAARGVRVVVAQGLPLFLRPTSLDRGRRKRAALTRGGEGGPVRTGRRIT